MYTSLLPFNVTVFFSDGYQTTKKIFAGSYELAKQAPGSSSFALELWAPSGVDVFDLTILSVEVVPVIEQAA